MTFAEQAASLDRLFLLTSPAGARVIGGNLFFDPSCKWVVYHSRFPVIRISFAKEWHGPVSSAILKRGRSWQSTLPVTKLGIPSKLILNQALTQHVPVPDGQGGFIIDLRPFSEPKRPPKAEAEPPANDDDGLADPLKQAERLIFKLGALFGEVPGLRERVWEELGIQLLVEDRDGDDE